VRTNAVPVSYLVRSVAFDDVALEPEGQRPPTNDNDPHVLARIDAARRSPRFAVRGSRAVLVAAFRADPFCASCHGRIRRFADAALVAREPEPVIAHRVARCFTPALREHNPTMLRVARKES
jgi:hypothetical protein